MNKGILVLVIPAIIVVIAFVNLTRNGDAPELGKRLLSSAKQVEVNVNAVNKGR
jgi:hypothetical protein